MDTGPKTGLWRRAQLPLISLAAFILVAALTSSVLGSGEDPGNCAACHQGEPVLPLDHPPTEGMNAAGCFACHQDGTPLTLETKMPLSHFHMLAGVTCASCHGETQPTQSVSTEQCLVCHGPLESLAALTAEVKPHNPHMTPHGPTFAQCNLCHQVHQASTNFCADCHDFDYVVP